MAESSRIPFVDSSDFITEEQYALYNIDPHDVPQGFKVWRHPYPPVDRYMSIYGGNVFGLSITEMMIGEIDEKTLNLLTSNNYKKINRYYREKGIYIIRSRELKEFFLIPTSLEAQLRREIDYKITQIINVINRVLQERNLHELSVGTFADTEDIIFNVLKARIPKVKFTRISEVHIHREVKFDLIYISSESRNVLEYIYGLERSKFKQIKTNDIPFFLSYAYDFLNPGGILYIISQGKFTKNPKHFDFSINKEDGEFGKKKLLLFSHIFDSNIKLNGKRVTMDCVDLFNFLRSPHFSDQRMNKMFGTSKSWKFLSEDEINDLPYKSLKFPNDNIAFDSVLFYKELFEELERENINPPYFMENMKEVFNITELPFKRFSTFLLKKRVSYPISKIRKHLEDGALCGSSIELVAPYKRTFPYVIEVLKIMEEIRRFNFDRSIADMKEAAFPFRIDGITFPINQVMKVQHLIDENNHYFKPVLSLIEKVPLLRKTWKSVGNLDKNVNIIEHMDKLYMCGFGIEELKEIFWIITGHGPISRVVFGKYPLKSMEILTDKIDTGCLTFKCMENLLEYFTFCSILEVVAANRRECTVEQWNRYFELLRYGKNVAGDLERKVTWYSLQVLEIEKYEGTLNTVAQVLARVFRYYVPEKLALCATTQEFLVDVDYSERKSRQLQELRELLELMMKFKEKNYPEDDFSRPYFFREFLECEIHGAGRSITKFGLCRAFKLLWLMVVPSGCKKINFNTFPVNKENIQSIKDDLDNLNERDLSIVCLEDVKEQLFESGSAFVYDTGFQVHVEKNKDVVSLSYINIGNGIKKVKKIIASIKKNPFLQYEHKVLKDLEDLFSEVAKYDSVYEKEIFRFSQLGGSPARIDSMSKNKREIQRITFFLYNTFKIDLFNPTDIYTKFKLLSDYSPFVLSLIIHEFAEYEDVKIKRKEYIRTLTDYTLKCMRKLQALATSSRDDFQNVELFNERYMAEFGNNPVLSIALPPESIQKLENTFKALPYHFQIALGVALTFQDIAKLPSLRAAYGDAIDFASHGEAGAELLVRVNTLANLGINAYTARVVILLIRYHGIIGQIIRGEYYLETLFPILKEGNPDFLNVFFLHCVLAVSAFEDDFLTFDLYKEFHKIWDMLKWAIKEADPNQAIVDKYLKDGDCKAWNISSINKKGNVFPSGKANSRQGKEVLFIERLLKVIGCPGIQLQDIITAINNPELSSTFFYRDAGVRNIGMLSHNIQMTRALSFYKAFIKLKENQRDFLVDVLTSLSDNIRFLFLENALAHLSPTCQLKLIIIAVRGYTHCKSKLKSDKNVSNIMVFDGLLSALSTRKEKIVEELESISNDELFNDSYISTFLKNKKGIILKPDKRTFTISVEFSDPVNMGKVLDKINSFTSIRELERYVGKELALLQKNGNIFEDQIALFKLNCNKKLDELKCSAIGLLQDRAEKISADALQGKVEPIKLKDFYDRIVKTRYFSKRHINLLRDKYEYLAGITKNELAYDCLDNLRKTESLGDLELVFHKITVFLRKNHAFFGKDFHDVLFREYIQKKVKLREKR